MADPIGYPFRIEEVTGKGSVVSEVPAGPESADSPGRHGDREDDTADQVFVPALLRREGRPEQPVPIERTDRAHRAIAAAVGLVLACGIVTASTAALAGPRTDRSMPGPLDDSIVGAGAVRPEEIAETMDRAVPGVLQPRGAATAPVPEPAPEEAVTAAPAAPAPPAPPTPPSETGGLGEALDPVRDPALDPVLGTVTSFFQTAATAPADAFGLLDASMQGSGPDTFRDSWADVQGVRLDGIVKDGPQSAVVWVTLVRADGEVLRTLQRVVVTAGPEPRIESATLLSAATS